MTTKPKAKKFRIRRNAPQPSGAASQPSAVAADTGDDQLFAPSKNDDGFGDAPFPTATATATPTAAAAQPGPVPPATVPASVLEPAARAEQAIAAIRQEGLTGRQLRMARRVAQKHDLAPTSDFDAVRLLRERGIDPFQRGNALELVVSDKAAQQPAQLPQTAPQRAVAKAAPQPNLPSTQVVTEDTRAKEIIKMQRDIVRRRRRKLLQLVTRLAFFVLLPTLIAGYYFFNIATPMYSTKSEFVIQQAQPSMGGGQGGLGSLFSGTSLATSQDSIAVQGYLGSLEAMLRLEQDVGFISHFADPDIDPLQRLEAGATKEDAHKLYKKHVKISYDPAEGIIKMEVIAADPLVAQVFAERLIFYAEEQVDQLTQRLREDQMSGAEGSLADAELKVVAAQQTVQKLQEKLGVLDPITEQQALMTQVTTFETQLQEKRLQLQQLLDNARPNRPRVDAAQGDIRRLEALIGELRAQMTVTSSSSASLASISGQLRLAEADLQTRQTMLAMAMQQMETARIEANRQTRYLENSVKPIAPDTPSYPRKFENTLLALLIFAGVYLMVSLTAAILREQVSA